jgi:predicted ATPase
LLIITYRPEFEPPWIGRSYVTALNLNRLGEREIAAMIDRVTGNKALPESIRQDIIERTDGIPLFVEEMTKAVLEAEGEGAAESAVATIPSPSVGVPASLHASLTARLDRLGPAKEVAQIGAAVGREFSHALLQAVVRQPEAQLQSALDRLVTAGLLFRQGVRRTRPIFSNMLWFRTRPTALFCVSRDARFMPVSPKLLRTNSLRLLRARLNYWRATAPKPE